MADVLQMQYIPTVKKDANINIRIERELKANVEKILQNLGISTSQAIQIYFSQILNHSGLPFEMRIPNNTTMNTLQNTDDRKNLHQFPNKEELLKDLDL